MSLKHGIKDAIKSMPAESRNQMLEALSTLRGYQDTLPDGSPNPVGRHGFVARTIAEQMAAETAMYFQQKPFASFRLRRAATSARTSLIRPRKNRRPNRPAG